MGNLILSRQAVVDVDLIHAYISADNPNAADLVQKHIFDAFDLLAQNPGLGRLRNFRSQKNIRSWVITQFPKYLIFYRGLPDGSGVEVVRVLHGARNLEALLQANPKSP